MATIKDVAERSGVAPSTVSYVLSGSRKISDETRGRVLEAVRELGYHPRASARTLRSSRSSVLALAVPREAGKYRAVDGRFAVEISDAARVHGFDVLLMTDPDGVRGLRRVAGSGLADAAVLMAVEEGDPRVRAMTAAGFPVALLGHGDARDETEVPWVDLDWEAAVALAVREAAAAGHRHIAFLSSAEHEITSRRGYALHGLAGARRAARQTGAEVTVRASSEDPGVAAARVRELLAAERPPTALVVQHLIPLPQVLAELSAGGVRLPEELAVVPVGTIPDESGLPELPRIDLPVSRMAAAVTGLALAAAEALPPSGGEPAESGPRHELFEPRMAAGVPIAPPRTPNAH
ncbi:LacI family DNA-binding transcriptional regulator [Streptomyces spiramenti]|uniref:LacI family transcriptional regulator n=1 Tax=Streptomyces spiramenti TaxID=2720606 RepID=A0ABX1ASL2_9ACTN|nr:LacI family DNA-binding transcriptional regulator [Streptomyces spiramenti]NJP67220.1 LacI family transcriptional regulator [Streptomyces spiramenti]